MQIRERNLESYVEAQTHRHGSRLPKTEHRLPGSANPKERDFAVGKDVRQGQGELVSIEGDRSIEVADGEMSFEQVNDGNEIFRSHILKIRCPGDPLVTRKHKVTP